MTIDGVGWHLPPPHPPSAGSPSRHARAPLADMPPHPRHPAVYLLASQRLGTLYIGVTSNLVQRIWQHREGLADGFTARHGVKRLVWYEQHETMPAAIAREKALKRWRRAWKIGLIEQGNPGWRDLWEEITGAQG